MRIFITGTTHVRITWDYCHYITLIEALKPIKHMVRDQHHIHLKNMKNYFGKLRNTLQEVLQIAHHKQEFQALVTSVMSC